jgi:hypothetical protein
MAPKNQPKINQMSHQQSRIHRQDAVAGLQLVELGGLQVLVALASKRGSLTRRQGKMEGRGCQQRAEGLGIEDFTRVLTEF